MNTTFKELIKAAGLNPAALPDLQNMEVGPSLVHSGKPTLDPRRTGMITASHAGEISYAKNGKDWSVATEKLVLRVVHERLTGKPQEKYTGSQATDWGHKYEPHAAEYFEKVTGLKCSPSEFLISKQFEIIGGTPDRLLEKSHLQIKCPFTVEVVMSNLRAKTPPTENLKQVWMEMICTGYDTAYWVSFDPRSKDWAPAKMKIIQVEKDDDYLEFEEMVRELEKYTLKIQQEMAGLFRVKRRKK